MNGIYSFFRLKTSGSQLLKNRMGRVVVGDGKTKVIEDYHSHRLREAMPDGPFDEIARNALLHQMNSKYILVRPWDSHMQDKDDSEIPEAKLDEMPKEVANETPSVFEYMKVGMSQPQILESQGDVLILNGHALSPAEASTILSNVHKGVATLRYHRPPDVLHKAEEKAPEPKDDDLTRDIMIPSFGNLLALERSKPTNVVISLDLNDFHKANEVGWKEADEAIVAFGELVAKLAHGDSFRDGGDCFVLFMDSKEDAFLFLRQLIEGEKELPAVSGSFKITMSAGIGNSLESARQAMAIAKHGKYKDSKEQASDSVYVAGDSLVGK